VSDVRGDRLLGDDGVRQHTTVRGSGGELVSIAGLTELAQGVQQTVLADTGASSGLARIHVSKPRAVMLIRSSKTVAFGRIVVPRRRMKVLCVTLMTPPHRLPGGGSAG
jgi:predicted membrane GTPase involved in stress response